MKYLIILISFVLGCLTIHCCAYEDKGRSYFAKFEGCDNDALLDIYAMYDRAVLATELSGATILCTNDHEFEGGGYTWFAVLAESHASIHTYPEYNSCFIDLFTCGDKCNHQMFIELMKDYLKPQSVIEQTIER